MDKRANNRSRKPRGEASKARNMASRTPRGLFVISRSGVQVRPPAPALPWGTSEYGGVPEWPKGTDCKSAGYAYGGSNPPAPTRKALIVLNQGFFVSEFCFRTFCTSNCFEAGDLVELSVFRQWNVKTLCDYRSDYSAEIPSDPQLTHTRKN